VRFKIAAFITFAVGAVILGLLISTKWTSSVDREQAVKGSSILVSYNFTESCLGNYTVYATTRESNGAVVINGRISPNCCSDRLEVVANRSNDVIFVYIFEEDFDGLLCRCLCPRDFSIVVRGIGEKLVVLWSTIYGGGVKNVKILREAWLGEGNEFCGQSTYGECRSDADCVRDGCSGEVCRSALEGPVATMCLWRECYDVKKYGVKCACVEGMCQWIK